MIASSIFFSAPVLPVLQTGGLQDPQFPPPPPPTDVAHRRVEITRLLPEAQLDTLRQAVRTQLTALGLTDAPDANQVFLHRYDQREAPDFAAGTSPRLFICLTRWRERKIGVEARLGESIVGFDAEYGQGLLVRAGLPLRIKSQRRQVFWVLEA